MSVESEERLISDGIPKWLTKDGYYYYGIVPVVRSSIHPWKCGICYYAIPEDKNQQKKNMQYHIETKHYTVYKCSTSKCKKQFFDKTELQLHIFIEHHDDLIYIKPSSPSSSQSACSICGKSYKKTASLKKHELGHAAKARQEDTLTTIFKCTYCDRGFTRKYNKLRHEETHLKSKSERKQHMGPLCQKPHTKDGITSHLRLFHKQGKKINYVKCQENNCLQQFSSLSRLKIHIKLVHSN